jgi:RNA polymerase sigma factor (sigma-70 family)
MMGRLGEAVQLAMDWAEIYLRLKRNRNDQTAWDGLEAGVRAWARPDLWNRGWALVDDVVAETSAEALLALERARGAETFAGFVRGHYLNVRRRTLVARQAAVTSLEGVDPPATTERSVEPPEWRVLDACLETLPAREREAVRLRYYEDAAAERIAAALAVTPGNARRIVFNGLARLRRCASQTLPARPSAGNPARSSAGNHAAL